jgi:hypothetical protein
MVKDAEYAQVLRQALDLRAALDVIADLAGADDQDPAQRLEEILVMAKHALPKVVAVRTPETRGE